MNFSITDLIGTNLDLLSVGIAIAGIGVLGFLVYLNNKKSITNKSFLAFALITIVWGISNYLEYKFDTVGKTLWALRSHLFISVWHALSFFTLSYIFPYEEKKFPKWYKYYLVPLVIFTSLLTLSPFVFSRITELAPLGEVTNPERGFGIVIFSLVAFGLLIAGLTSLLIKTIKSSGVERKQTAFIMTGMFLTACLILLFNVVLPVVLNNLGFIPLAALFVFPFIALTSYTIYRHRLFNIKVAVVSFVSFLITIFSFTNVIYSTDLTGIILNSTAFIIILFGSIELIKAMMDLEIANEQQQNLIHFISHEVKGFLSKSRSIFSIIEEGDYGPLPEYLKAPVTEGLNSGKKGVDMVQDILNASNLKKGTVQYKLRKFDLKNIFSEVASDQRKNAETKGLSFDVHLDESKNYEIVGDAEQMKHVFKNLIDNSIKYTLKGGLSINLSNDSQKILFFIKDTGVGINPEDRKHLFTEGIKGKNSMKVNVESTGYGLFIAKKIVEAHKGRIWVESEGSGKGSTFFVELPQSQSN